MQEEDIAPVRGVFAYSDDEVESAGQAVESDEVIELPDTPFPVETPAAEDSDTTVVSRPRVVIPRRQKRSSGSVEDFTQGGDVVRRVVGELNEVDKAGGSVY